jgi:hypothetical protein
MPRKLRFITEWDALEYLKHDSKVIDKHLLLKKNSLGLKKLGAVDFLVNKHHYTYTYK